HACRRQSLGGGDFHRQPSTEAVLFAPDTAHLPSGIARNQAAQSPAHACGYGTPDSKRTVEKRPAPRSGAWQPGESIFLSFYDILQERKGLHRDKIGSMKKLTSSDYQALAEFRFQIRKFLHFSEQAVQEAGLERGQYQLMLAIKGMPAGVRPRVAELAGRMQIQHTSAVALVK